MRELVSFKSRKCRWKEQGKRRLEVIDIIDSSAPPSKDCQANRGSKGSHSLIKPGIFKKKIGKATKRPQNTKYLNFI